MIPLNPQKRSSTHDRLLMCVVGVTIGCTFLSTSATIAQIVNWQTGKVIPGTESIALGPLLRLSEWNTNEHHLRFADLSQRNLRGSSFFQVWLDSSRWQGSNIANGLFSQSSLQDSDFSNADLSESYFPDTSLKNANLSSANLSFANFFDHTDLTGANLTGANIEGANFGATFGNGRSAVGFTQDQLRSTASYQHRNLRDVAFDSLNLTNWDFTNQDLSGAQFQNTTLGGAVFAGATITSARFRDSNGMTKEQLYSTASYQQRNLTNVALPSNLANWDFSNQDLSGASLEDARVEGALFTDANITNTDFINTVGLTKEQVYSTASYKSKNLQGVRLYGKILSGWDLSGQDLSNAALGSTTLTNTDFTNAVVRGTEFWAVNNPNGGLSKAQLYSTASYQEKNLQGIELCAKNLRDWDFSGQDLTNAGFNRATITNVNFSGATVRGAVLGGTAGFTKEQLYSTASYQAKALQSIGLWELTLTGIDLSGQDLRNAMLGSSRLTNASFLGANLTNVSFNSATLTGADFTGAVIHGDLAQVAAFSGGTTDLSFTTGFTKEQLYSTASYQAKNLRRIQFPNKNLTGWDFKGQDLSQSGFAEATLTNADFTDAVINGTSFGGTKGFTKEQLYSTASYRQKNLSGLNVASQSVSDWNLSGQNLMNSQFFDVNWTGADLSFADTRFSYFGDQFPTELTARNTIRPDSTIAGLQLESGERLVIRDFDPLPEAWDAPLAISVQQQFTMSDGSFLKLEFDADHWDSTIRFDPRLSVNLDGTLELDFAQGVDVPALFGRSYQVFDWSQVTPTGQLQIASSFNWDLSQLYTTGQIVLKPNAGSPGDFDGDGAFTVLDIDRLSAEVRSVSTDLRFDLNRDSRIDGLDRTAWIHDLRRTYFGDADLDGQFNTNDLIAVFQAGQYEDTIVGNSTWSSGDWDGDGDFTTSDLVSAFQDGGYEQGPRPVAAAVPEPSSWLWLAFVVCSRLRGRRRG